MAIGEIIVLPFPHPGHLFPATELCLLLAQQNCEVTLILPSSASSPSSLHPLIRIIQLPVSDSIRIDPSFLNTELPNFITDLLADRRDSSSLPVCAIVDEMIGWLVTSFVDFGVPAISFFTSSAISSSLEHASLQIDPPDSNTTAGVVVPVPGLPENVALTAFDIASFHRNGGPPTAPFGPRLSQDGRPRRMRDVASTDGAVGLIMNTCVDLERSFLDYVARVAGKPVWAVGPLLPARSHSAPEDSTVIAWLDGQPRGSVIYVSFGSLVSPSDAELEELAAGLEESGRPFIWVVQPASRQYGADGRALESNGGFYFPEELERKAVGRGMVIKGWAPQLLILKHPSTGGYVCHCGWNSAMEAVVSGVPVLAWPIRGDQAHNAKLLVNHLRVGVAVRPAPGKAVGRAQVVEGIEKLLTDGEMRKRAESVSSVFAEGVPRSSASALNGFVEFLASDCGRSEKLVA